MSHSFACQKISCQLGTRPSSRFWRYVSEPSRTAGTRHAAAMSSQSRPIFTSGSYQLVASRGEDEQRVARGPQRAVVVGGGWFVRRPLTVIRGSRFAALLSFRAEAAG